LTVAEKLRSAIADMPGPIRITASIGVAEVIPQRPLADVIALADAALFEAKEGGRDQVRLRL
jgi:PleD family two-component response regulator